MKILLLKPTIIFLQNINIENQNICIKEIIIDMIEKEMDIVRINVKISDKNLTITKEKVVNFDTIIIKEEALVGEKEENIIKTMHD